MQFADEVTAEDVGLERPKLRGGQAEKILRGVSEHQQAFIRQLNVRRQAIKPKFKPEPGEDTVVAIGTDGLTSAVDLRLLPALKLWEAGIDRPSSRTRTPRCRWSPSRSSPSGS